MFNFIRKVFRKEKQSVDELIYFHRMSFDSDFYPPKNKEAEALSKMCADIVRRAKFCNRCKGIPKPKPVKVLADGVPILLLYEKENENATNNSPAKTSEVEAGEQPAAYEYPESYRASYLNRAISGKRRNRRAGHGASPGYESRRYRKRQIHGRSRQRSARDEARRARERFGVRPEYLDKFPGRQLGPYPQEPRPRSSVVWSDERDDMVDAMDFGLLHCDYQPKRFKCAECGFEHHNHRAPGYKPHQIFYRDLYGRTVILCSLCDVVYMCDGVPVRPATWWRYEYVQAKDRDRIKKELFRMGRPDLFNNLAHTVLDRDLVMYEEKGEYV